MMLEHFYVNKNTDAQGNHEVHRENCDYLQRPENREYLGFFPNSYDAALNHTLGKKIEKPIPL